MTNACFWNRISKLTYVICQSRLYEPKAQILKLFIVLVVSGNGNITNRKVRDSLPILHTVTDS